MLNRHYLPFATIIFPIRNTPTRVKNMSAQAEETKKLFVNRFTTISCEAINAVIHACEDFDSIHRYLTKVEDCQARIEGDGSGKFSKISADIKVYIKGRKAKEVTVTDEWLRRVMRTYPDFAHESSLVMPRKPPAPRKSVDPSIRYSKSPHALAYQLRQIRNSNSGKHFIFNGYH